MKINFPQKNTGFTLVETLVAISIFTVSLLGLMSVLASGITTTNYAKQKILASYLAQEGVEYIRNVRDNNVLYPSTGKTWNSFNTQLSTCTSVNNACGFNSFIQSSFFSCVSFSCKLYINNGRYDTNAGGVDSGFVRKVWMTNVSADEVSVYSTVSWTQSSGNYSVTFSENLTNWIE